MDYPSVLVHMHTQLCVQPKQKKTGWPSTQTQAQQTMWSPHHWWSVYGMNTTDNLCSQSGKIAQIEPQRTIHWPVYPTLIAERFTSTIHLLQLQQPHTSRRPVPPICPDLMTAQMCSDSSRTEIILIQSSKQHENLETSPHKYTFTQQLTEDSRDFEIVWFPDSLLTSAAWAQLFLLGTKWKKKSLMKQKYILKKHNKQVMCYHLFFLGCNDWFYE